MSPNPHIGTVIFRNRLLASVPVGHVGYSKAGNNHMARRAHGKGRNPNPPPAVARDDE